MEIKKRNWNEVSITDYKKIRAICADELSSDMEKNLSTLAVICDCTEDEIYSLPVQEVQGLIRRMDWLDRFEFNQDFHTTKIKIDNERYTIEPDLQKMTVSQYIDFQNFWASKDRENNMGFILACFIVPEGKKYGEGYDAVALARKFEDRLSIAFYNEVVFFSLRDWLNSIEAMRIYCKWTLKRLKRKEKDPERIALLEAKIRELEEISFNGFAS